MSVSFQTKLTKMTVEEARSFILDCTIDGREGFFCLTSNMDLDPLEIRRKYRDKDCVEKLFASMKGDIGIRPIRTWTNNGVYGVLLIGFLAQALISVTRILAKPASGRATKFISDAMQKLTLTIKHNRMKGSEFIISNFNTLNTSILRAFGLIPEIIGRLPVLSYMDPLDAETLRAILTEPKNAIIKQYKKLFEMDDIKFTITDGALDFIVGRAIDYKLGARGLRSLCEEILTDAMFELPSSTIKKLHVTREYAEDKLDKSTLKRLKAVS